MLLERVGKTSEARTQLTGPKEREKTMEVRKIIAMPARWAARLGVLEVEGGKEETRAARMENVHMKVQAPKRRGFFRPMRSMRRVMKLG